MKKSTIWLLISILVVVFVSLIAVELSYMRSLIHIHTTDFDGAVHRSLARVAYFLERDETQRYLQNELEERDRQLLDVQSSMKDWVLVSPSATDKDSIRFDVNMFANPDLYMSLWKESVLTKDEESSIPLNLDDVMSSEDLKDKYLRQKDLLNDVVLRILHRAAKKPVEQRVDFSQLQAYMDAELDMQGLTDVPYYYVVKDINGKVVYISENFEDYYDGFNLFNYHQDLFINDQGSKHPVLSVYFPTRDEYRHTPLAMFIPMLGLSLVLVILSIMVVVSFLRQKRYSDMKTDFINNMTHELKTPVSCISLAAQMLSDKDVPLSPAAMNHITTVITDESKRLSLLVEKVLQLSVFSKESKTVNFQELNINEVVDVVVQTFKLKVEQSGGRIECNLNAVDTFVLADEMHITNVLFNLMDNAMKYSSDKRPIMLKINTVNIDDSFIELSVSDNGIGISRENLKRIFDRFFRVQTGNVHNVKGFGLGLPYVQMIIQKHHGKITVESELDEGTTFYITLPIIKTY